MLVRLSMIAGIVSTLGVAGTLPVMEHAPVTDAAIIGKWKGDTFAGGATAQISLEFFANSTYAKRVISTTEFGWTLDGATLLLAPAMMGADGAVTYGKASALQVTFEGDAMIAASRGQSMSLHRVTWPVKDAPLLGRWEGQTDLNEGITQDFTADGRLLVAVTLSREAGRYTAGDGTISWEEQIPNPSRRKSRYRMENGKLMLYISTQLPPIELVRDVPEATGG